jgi:N-carbamoylputrescine amidase
MRVRVTVCELNSEPDALEAEWGRLARHTRAEGSELVLLPEMPFAAWFAWTKAVDAAVWRAAVEAHARWLAWLPELGAAQVLGSRPVEAAGRRLNEGFIWDVDHGYRAAHPPSPWTWPLPNAPRPPTPAMSESDHVA